MTRHGADEAGVMRTLGAAHGRDVARATVADSAELAALLAEGEAAMCPECGCGLDTLDEHDCGEARQRADAEAEGAEWARGRAARDARLAAAGRIVCETCDGSGTVLHVDDFRRCPECDGAGSYPLPLPDPRGAGGAGAMDRTSAASAASPSPRSTASATRVPCPACSPAPGVPGSGTDVGEPCDRPCPECSGAGLVERGRRDSYHLARLRSVADDLARAVWNSGRMYPGEGEGAEIVHGHTEALLLVASYARDEGARLPEPILAVLEEYAHPLHAATTPRSRAIGIHAEHDYRSAVRIAAALGVSVPS